MKTWHSWFERREVLKRLKARPPSAWLSGRQPSIAASFDKGDAEPVVDGFI